MHASVWTYLKRMGESSNRSGEFRYTVAPQGADITPMAAVEVFRGPFRYRVLNLSLGGLALLFEKEPDCAIGDILDVSASIRDRGFPVRIEVRGIKGFRVSCSFVSPSKIFLGSLREFLRPKFLGATLKRNEALAQVDAASGAKFDVYSGENRALILVWSGRDGTLKKLVASSADLVFEWSEAIGFRTGRLGPQVTENWDLDQISTEALELLADTAQAAGRIKWDRVVETPILHYFADIFLAWLDSGDGSQFVEELMRAEEGRSADRPLKFPRRG